MVAWTWRSAGLPTAAMRVGDRELGVVVGVDAPGDRRAPRVASSDRPRVADDRDELVGQRPAVRVAQDERPGAGLARRPQRREGVVAGRPGSRRRSARRRRPASRPGRPGTPTESAIMSRFSCGRRAEHLDHVEQPALAEDRHDRRLGRDQLAQVRVVVGPVRPMAGGAERGQPRGLPASSSGRPRRTRCPWGSSPASRPRCTGMPYSSSIRAIAQLVGQRERDVLALRAVAQRRVVEDDRAGRRASSSMRRPRRAEPLERSRRSSRAFRRRGPARTSRRPRRASEVARPEAAVERRRDRAPRSPRPRPSRPSDQRSSIAAGQDRPDRVRQVPAGDVRRRAVDRLVQPEQAVRRPPLAERRRRQHAERAGQHARLVRQDVAEQVLGDEDVERRRPRDERASRTSRPAGGRARRPGTPRATSSATVAPEARGREDVRPCRRW